MPKHSIRFCHALACLVLWSSNVAHARPEHEVNNGFENGSEFSNWGVPECSLEHSPLLGNQIRATTRLVIRNGVLSLIVNDGPLSLAMSRYFARLGLLHTYNNGQATQLILETGAVSCHVSVSPNSNAEFPDTESSCEFRVYTPITKARKNSDLSVDSNWSIDQVSGNLQLTIPLTKSRKAREAERILRKAARATNDPGIESAEGPKMLSASCSTKWCGITVAPNGTPPKSLP